MKRLIVLLSVLFFIGCSVSSKQFSKLPSRQSMSMEENNKYREEIILLKKQGRTDEAIVMCARLNQEYYFDETASYLLQGLGEKGIPTLLMIDKNYQKPFKRYTTIKIIGDLGQKAEKATPYLLECLLDKNENLERRHQASIAFGKIAPSKLREIAEDKSLNLEERELAACGVNLTWYLYDVLSLLQKEHYLGTISSYNLRKPIPNTLWGLERREDYIVRHTYRNRDDFKNLPSGEYFVMGDSERERELTNIRTAKIQIREGKVSSYGSAMLLSEDQLDPYAAYALAQIINRNHDRTMRRNAAFSFSEVGIAKDYIFKKETIKELRSAFEKESSDMMLKMYIAVDLAKAGETDTMPFIGEVLTGENIFNVFRGTGSHPIYSGLATSSVLDVLETLGRDSYPAFKKVLEYYNEKELYKMSKSYNFPYILQVFGAIGKTKDERYVPLLREIGEKEKDSLLKSIIKDECDFLEGKTDFVIY